MAKTPRPSIADQLAAVASTRPRDDVETLERGRSLSVRHVESKSLVDNEITLPRHNIATRKRDNETAEGLKIRQRVEKPHASLYAHPRVFKKFREIAAAEDCKPHDLYVEGLRMVLARYGFDLEKLERGES